MSYQVEFIALAVLLATNNNVDGDLCRTCRCVSFTEVGFCHQTLLELICGAG